MRELNQRKRQLASELILNLITHLGPRKWEKIRFIQSATKTSLRVVLILITAIGKHLMLTYAPLALRGNFNHPDCEQDDFIRKENCSVLTQILRPFNLIWRNRRTTRTANEISLYHRFWPFFAGGGLFLGVWWELLKLLREIDVFSLILVTAGGECWIIHIMDGKVSGAIIGDMSKQLRLFFE